jgi:hypothetical protein
VPRDCSTPVGPRVTGALAQQLARSAAGSR